METGFSCKLILYLDSVFKHKHKLIHNQGHSLNITKLAN